MHFSKIVGDFFHLVGIDRNFQANLYDDFPLKSRNVIDHLTVEILKLRKQDTYFPLCDRQ